MLTVLDGHPHTLALLAGVCGIPRATWASRRWGREATWTPGSPPGRDAGMAGRHPRWRRDATRDLVRRGRPFRFARIRRGPELVCRRGLPGQAPLGWSVRPDAAPAQRPPVRRHGR